MLGAVVSDFILVGAVALGLGALLAASEFWFSVRKWVGSAYLAWLGFRLLRSQGGFEILAGEAAAGQWMQVGEAMKFIALCASGRGRG